jgi:hypothetical protein
MKPANTADHEIDERVTKWIPFVGPGAALFVLFVIYLILAGIFS